MMDGKSRTTLALLLLAVGCSDTPVGGESPQGEGPPDAAERPRLPVGVGDTYQDAGDGGNRAESGAVCARSTETALLPQDALVTPSISFEDPGSANAAYYTSLSVVISAAVELWSRKLVTAAPINLKIVVSFSSSGTASSASTTATLIGTRAGVSIFEQGAATKFRTGSRGGANANDVSIIVSSAFLRTGWWFDPAPLERTAAVPTDRSDAVSSFLHELDHAFGMSGWLNQSTGASTLPGGDLSAYDANVGLTAGAFYFTGEQARAVYGGPVPLTLGSYGHYGNVAPRPGDNLQRYLMWGPFGYNGPVRLDISELDLAMFRDLGLKTHRDVGSTGAVGRASLAAKRWALKGSGAFGTTSDSFQFAYRALEKDGFISGGVLPEKGTSKTAIGGFLIRYGLDADASYVGVLRRESGELVVANRRNRGAPSTLTPLCAIDDTRIKLERVGETVRGYASRDGTSWGAPLFELPAPPGVAFVGLASTSGIPGTLAGFGFDDVVGL